MGSRTPRTPRSYAVARHVHELLLRPLRPTRLGEQICLTHISQIPTSLSITATPSTCSERFRRESCIVASPVRRSIGLRDYRRAHGTAATPTATTCNPTMTAAPPAPALTLRLRIGLPHTETCAASAAPAASTNKSAWRKPPNSGWRAWWPCSAKSAASYGPKERLVEVGDSYAGSGTANIGGSDSTRNMNGRSLHSTIRSKAQRDLQTLEPLVPRRAASRRI